MPVLLLSWDWYDWLFCIYFWQRSLAIDLQNLSMDLRRKQSAYLKRLQQQKEVSTFYV